MDKDKLVFRMSDAGECPKAIVAERLGHKPTPSPPWLKLAAEEGKWHEKRIKDELRSEGYEVEECEACPICLERYGNERQGIHVELEYENFVLIGHLDAKVRKNELRQGAEIKSRSQFEFDRWMKEGFGGFPDNAGQLTVYMEADSNSSWLYIVKNRSSGYEDRRIVTEPPAILADILGKFGLAARCIRLGVLPEVEFDSNSLQCRRCRFSQLCVPEVKKADLVKLADLQSAAEEWRKGKRLIATGEGLVNVATEAFEEHSKATGLDKWRFNELVINFIHIKERLSYPKDKLLQIFTEKQLKPASIIKLPYDYVKVTDTKKEEIGNAEISE